MESNEQSPHGGFGNLLFARDIFYAYLREELLSKLDASKPIALVEEHRSSLTIQPLLILSSYAIENLVKACVWEAFISKEMDEEVKKLVNSHKVSEMIRVVEREWRVVLPPHLWRYTDSLEQQLLWQMKYAHPKQGIGPTIRFVYSDSIASAIRDLWNFLSNAISERSLQIKIALFQDLREGETHYEYLEKIMRKDFRDLVS